MKILKTAAHALVRMLPNFTKQARATYLGTLDRPMTRAETREFHALIKAGY